MMFLLDLSRGGNGAIIEVIEIVENCYNTLYISNWEIITSIIVTMFVHFICIVIHCIVTIIHLCTYIKYINQSILFSK